MNIVLLYTYIGQNNIIFLSEIWLDFNYVPWPVKR